NLVARDGALFEADHVAFGHVEVAAADAAAVDLDHHLALGGHGIRHGFHGQLAIVGMEDGGAHGRKSLLAMLAGARSLRSSRKASRSYACPVSLARSAGSIPSAFHAAV